MKCLECGQEMEEGYANATRLIIWTKKKKKLPIWTGSPKEEIVGSPGALLRIPTLKGWRCRSCRLYLLKEEPPETDRPYKDENPFLIKKENED